MSNTTHASEYSSMSKEELIKLLADKEQKIDFLRRQYASLDKQLEKKEQALQQQKKTADEYQRKAELYDTLMAAEAEAARIYSDSFREVGFDKLDEHLSRLGSMLNKYVKKNLCLRIFCKI